MTSERDDDAPRPYGRSALLAALVLALAVMYWPAGRAYPVVPSAEGQKIIKAVYAACNTRNTQRLDAAERRVEKAAAGGELRPGDADAFRRVIARARGGDWAGAEADAFRFAKDQVR